jgi:serine/threonine-protein kinase
MTHWCVDPGSELDYPVVKENLLRHVGDLRDIHLFSLNHQDPDVVANLRFLAHENLNLIGVVSEEVWRLVRHLNANPKRLYFTGKVKQNLLRLPDGHRIQVVPTPFCHFRGAVAYYDLETQILFSGDLFGGLNQPGRVQLLGEEQDWAGIAQFHQIYMPTRTAVEYAIRQIKVLDPPVEMIAPQHGFVLTGDFMHSVLDRLAALPVGLDLIPSELDEKYLAGYREIFRELLHQAAMELGRSDVFTRLNRLPADHELRQYATIGKQEAELMSSGIRAVPLLLEELTRDQFPAFRSRLKSHVLQRCTELGLPIPQLGAGVEEQSSWIGMQSLSLAPNVE